MKVFVSIVLVSSLLATRVSAVLQLKADNYLKLTEGKTVFVKFFAPWCGHCKAMAPDWVRLAEDWNGHDIGLVAEVDCTDAESEQLCEDFHVEGFPTLLYGDPSSPEEYFGGRDYDSLTEFAKQEINKPVCSVGNLDFCSEDDKKAIAEMLKKSKEELLEDEEGVELAIQKAQQELDDFVDEINDLYEQRTNEFNLKVEGIKADSNYKFMKQTLRKVHGVEDGEEYFEEFEGEEEL